MTQSETRARANRNGDPCPEWCTQTHGEPLVADKPELGYMNGHVSDPVPGGLGLRAEVRVRRSGFAGEAAAVDVTRYTLPVLSLSWDKASVLADLLDSLPTKSDVERFAGQLRIAAETARESE